MIEGGLAAGAFRETTRSTRLDWLRAIGIVIGLGVIVEVRALSTLVGFEPLLGGAAFGVALVVLGASAVAAVETPGAKRPRPSLPKPLEIMLGGVGGLVLIVLALVARLAAPAISAAPAAAFGPWAAVTILVATGEELVLRGALFGAVERVAGAIPAVAITSVAFAVMHVPLYGWHVVPLDLGVGIFLGGLRLAGGGWKGPAIAHAIADLATWWL